MNKYTNLTLPAILAAYWTFSPCAFASVVADASTEVSFTVNSISDLSNPTSSNTSGQIFTTAFDQASDPNLSYVLLSGDAQETQVSASLPPSVLFGNQFKYTDVISNLSANNGNASIFHTGTWTLAI
jgi:hypothetical protein